MLPIVFMLILMLCQPMVILYDRVVMEAAAAEGCRLIATRSSASQDGNAAEKYAAYVKRRLGTIPPTPLFHIHEPCSYVIALSGSEDGETVSVSIENRVKLFPLIGQAAGFLRFADADGTYVIRVEVSMPARPSWASGTPEEWLQIWDE